MSFEAVVIVGIIIGLTFLVIGLTARLGGMKGLYLVKGVSFIVPELAKYIFLPLGIYCTLLFILLLLPNGRFNSFLFDFIILPMPLLIVILGIWQPRWLLPYWLNYLHETYGYQVTQALLAEAGKDVRSWQKKVETHEGLVAWAEETARNWNLPLEARPPD